MIGGLPNVSTALTKSNVVQLRRGTGNKPKQAPTPPKRTSSFRDSTYQDSSSCKDLTPSGMSSSGEEGTKDGINGLEKVIEYKEGCDRRKNGSGANGVVHSKSRPVGQSPDAPDRMSSSSAFPTSQQQRIRKTRTYPPHMARQSSVDSAKKTSEGRPKKVQIAALEVQNVKRAINRYGTLPKGARIGAYLESLRQHGLHRPADSGQLDTLREADNIGSVETLPAAMRPVANHNQVNSFDNSIATQFGSSLHSLSQSYTNNETASLPPEGSFTIMRSASSSFAPNRAGGSPHHFTHRQKGDSSCKVKTFSNNESPYKGSSSLQKPIPSPRSQRGKPFASQMEKVKSNQISKATSPENKETPASGDGSEIQTAFGVNLRRRESADDAPSSGNVVPSLGTGSVRRTLRGSRPKERPPSPPRYSSSEAVVKRHSDVSSSSPTVETTTPSTNSSRNSTLESESPSNICNPCDTVVPKAKDSPVGLTKSTHSDVDQSPKRSEAEVTTSGDKSAKSDHPPLYPAAQLVSELFESLKQKAKKQHPTATTESQTESTNDASAKQVPESPSECVESTQTRNSLFIEEPEADEENKRQSSSSISSLRKMWEKETSGGGSGGENEISDKKVSPKVVPRRPDTLKLANTQNNANQKQQQKPKIQQKSNVTASSPTQKLPPKPLSPPPSTQVHNQPRSGLHSASSSDSLDGQQGSGPTKPSIPTKPPIKSTKPTLTQSQEPLKPSPPNKPAVLSKQVLTKESGLLKQTANENNQCKNAKESDKPYNKSSVLEISSSLDSSIQSLKSSSTIPSSSMMQLSDKVQLLHSTCGSYAENIPPHGRFKFRELLSKLENQAGLIRTSCSSNFVENSKLFSDLQNTVQDLVNVVQR